MENSPFEGAGGEKAPNDTPDGETPDFEVIKEVDADIMHMEEKHAASKPASAKRLFNFGMWKKTPAVSEKADMPLDVAVDIVAQADHANTVDNATVLRFDTSGRLIEGGSVAPQKPSPSASPAKKKQRTQAKNKQKKKTLSPEQVAAIKKANGIKKAEGIP